MQSIAYLNNQFLPLEEARISPLDRGFLFGDGVYEVIPSYSGHFVGFKLHIERLQRNLTALNIPLDWSVEDWFDVAKTLLNSNNGDNLGVYIHVSRGADVKRFHAYAPGLVPTVFAYAFDIASPKVANKDKVAGLSAVTQLDMRWQQCHIKSTALLGNVLHFQHAHSQEAAETILYNTADEVTEASTSNVFMVKRGEIWTPPLDNQLLPGITRHIIVDILKTKSHCVIKEKKFSLDDLRQADEVWLTSSGKEIAPVTLMDGEPVGTGLVGDVWLEAMSYYVQHKFDY